VLRAIQQRDHLDETRVDGPLVCAPGAQRIDTSGLTLDQVVTELERRTRSAVPADVLAPPRVVQTA
jgi:cytidylate kinase